MASEQAISHWWTTAEWGWDARTDALAVLRERPRQPEDKPGKEKTVWRWSVTVSNEFRAAGVSQNQRGARAAVRKIIRRRPRTRLQRARRGANPENSVSSSWLYVRCCAFAERELCGNSAGYGRHGRTADNSAGGWKFEEMRSNQRSDCT